MIERNAGRHRVGERAAGIVEALIAEARTGVIPRADPVSARETHGILPFVGNARLRDGKGAATKAEDSAGGKRKVLIAAVAPTQIAAEHGGLKRRVIARLDPSADAGSGNG